MLTFYRLSVTNFDSFKLEIHHNLCDSYLMSMVLKDYVSKSDIIGLIRTYFGKPRPYFLKVFPHYSSNSYLQSLTRSQLLRILLLGLDVDNKFGLTLADFKQGFSIDFGFCSDSFTRCHVILK